MKVLLLLTLLGYGPLIGQADPIAEAPEVTKVMDMFRAYNKEKTEITGYRIQLIATTERRLMEAQRERFGKSFPNMKSRWNHVSPYYQVQAGAFATKQEALPELGRVKKKFPKAYLVVDQLSIDEVLARL